ncbi:hypothetical protein BCR35DRAFT_328243 [Leucosporidium creatinivorum]|uniref:Phytanoyl-CoA dioxygenase n=1 Tax=Leucosporidium creatinivorum TaxID=106004 RepID=A0A1Y2G576_9BASI|nr:hypothetical protein BCR35DRAFT_328243 [Leucosporidium creatinivorum]
MARWLFRLSCILSAFRWFESDVETPDQLFPLGEYHDLLTKGPFGDFRDALAQDGFVVVPAIEQTKALEYRERAFKWLEARSWGNGGFKRGDVSTYVNENLPVGKKGGMIHNYSGSAEQWVWDIRCEPGVVGAFAKLFGTEDLISSFDAFSIMLPGRKDIKDLGKWEHTDQSPSRVGIVNLNENGPEDGGLMVLKGSAALFKEFFDIEGRSEIRTWGPVDWYGFTEEQQQWFYSRGCEWVKVCAKPGDLILWDSRTLHYNRPPSGERDRVCTYVCMAPSHLASEEDRALRIEAFNYHRGTTHVPFANVFSRPHEPVIRLETGKPDPFDTGVPLEPVKLTPMVRQLVGLRD